LQTTLPELSLERFTEVVSKAWPADSEKRVVIDLADLASPKKLDPGFSVGVSCDLDVWVTLSPRPFVEAADIKQVSDLRSRQMLSAHRASISIHAVSGGHRKLSDDETLPATLIPLMTKLAAELVDAKTVGIIVPSEEILLSRGANLQSLLREKDPITALKNAANVPVVNSADDDPQIRAAVQEGQDESLRACRLKVSEGWRNGWRILRQSPIGTAGKGNCSGVIQRQIVHGNEVICANLMTVRYPLSLGVVLFDRSVANGD